MTDAEELVIDRRGPILVLRLNRPEARNALTLALTAGIGTTVADTEPDPEVRVVVLTGTGDRALCAGMDLWAFAGGDQVPALAVEVHLRPVLIEIGATVPTRGLYVTEDRLDDLATVIDDWLVEAAPLLRSSTGAP